MLVSQFILRYFGFNIKTKLIEGPVVYLHSFSACKPQRRTTSVQETKINVGYKDIENL